jgi:hypothetical protein
LKYVFLLKKLSKNLACIFDLFPDSGRENSKDFQVAFDRSPLLRTTYEQLPDRMTAAPSL